MKAKVLFALCVAAMVGGCARTIYLPTETYTEHNVSVADTAMATEVSKLIEQLRNTVTAREKVIVRDSVVEVRNEYGEVIIKEVYKSSDRDYSEKQLVEKIALKYDSIFSVQKSVIDSLSVKLTETPVPIERPISKWERFKSDVGTLAMGFAVALVAFAAIWLAKKIRKRG